MTSTTSFQNALAKFELRERTLTTQLLENWGIKESYFTSGGARYDGIATSADGRKAIIEIKVRSFAKNQFPNYFLEVSKFKSLYEASKLSGHSILYINYFTTEDPEKWDYLVFNISKRIAEWKVKGSPAIEKVRMNSKTFISKTDKIYKDIIRLEYEEDKDKTGSVFCSIN